MIKLEEFRKLEIPITWTLINIGYKGSETFRDELSSDEIINYAVSLQEYYTMQNYEKLYQMHVDWVKNKLANLR